MTGILSTTESQSVLLRPVLNFVPLTHDFCDGVGCAAELQVDPCVVDLLLLRHSWLPAVSKCLRTRGHWGFRLPITHGRDFVNSGKEGYKGKQPKYIQ